MYIWAAHTRVLKNVHLLSGVLPTVDFWFPDIASTRSLVDLNIYKTALRISDNTKSLAGSRKVDGLLPGHHFAPEVQFFSIFAD